jgi:hypothetical protein
MCRLHSCGELPSLVDEETFLAEIHAAYPTLRAHGVPDKIPLTEMARIAENCHEELSRELSTAWEKQFPGEVHELPLRGAFAPVDASTIQSDPSCTADLFIRVLRMWGIDPVTSDGVEQGIARAVRNLALEPGRVYGYHARLNLQEDQAITWMLRYTPFSVRSGQVGLLFAFAAAQSLPTTSEAEAMPDAKGSAAEPQ